MIILHNKESKESREFVELYASQCQVIDWYNDIQLVSIYTISGNPSPNTFPSIFDLSSKKLITKPSSLQDAINKIQSLDEPHILARRIKETNQITKSIILEGFESEKAMVIYNFPLSLSDQAGFTAKVNAFTTSDFPRTENESIPPYDFNNITEYKTVYREGMAHIETTRAAGKVIKNDLLSLTYQQLLDFIDPRS